jgi:MFS family permease
MSIMRANRDHIFYPALAILISATAFAGFAFTYFGPIIGGSYPPAGVPLHLHGWSFFLWYLLFPLQPLLIAKEKHNLHMKLGRLSVVLVVMMTLTGILVLTVRVEEAVRKGAPEIWLLYGPLILSNLVLFVSFYAAAIYMAVNNRLEAHKRLILVASAIGLGAGFFRLILFLSGFHPLSVPAGTLGCSIFIMIGIAYDYFTRRAVHPVYWIGLVGLLAVEGAMLPQFNEEAVAWINQGLAAVGEHLGVLYQPEPTVEF